MAIQIRLTAPMALAALLLVGCSDAPDERLTKMAENSVSVQARQNQQMARQTAEVTAASRQLVSADAHAREEMLAAYVTLQEEIERTREQLDQGRDLLEEERREIARQRQRDPVVAQAIGAASISVACLLPLLLAGYAMHCVKHAAHHNESLSELLVMEMAAARSSLSNSDDGWAARLEHRRPPQPAQEDDPQPPDDEVEPPF